MAVVGVVWLLLRLNHSNSGVQAFAPTTSTGGTALAITATASTTTTTTTLYAADSTTVPKRQHYDKVFVAGGSKGVGRLVIDELLAHGSDVQALVRDVHVAATLNALSNENHKVTAIVGDAFDQKTVETAMDGCDAVITTLGGSTRDNDDDEQRIDYIGNANVIESAGILGISRIILVTSVGCGSSKEAAPAAVFAALQPVLEAKEKAENLLLRYYTNSNWSIIRPGGLTSEPAPPRTTDGSTSTTTSCSSTAIVTQDTTCIGTIRRADVAALIVQCLESPLTERQIFTAVDPSIESAVAAPDQVIQAFAL